MAYRQPNVPTMRDGANPWTFIHVLTRFLRDFCLAAWKADKDKDAEIEALKKRIEALESK